MEIIKDTKPYLLAILESIDFFCKENHIPYFLMYGTLLGAIRHKGFIPWDDDVDIAIPRFYYDYFVKHFVSKDGKYKIIDPTNSKYYLPFAKVIDSTTLLVENIPNPLSIGVYVDVFPLDNCGNTLSQAQTFYKSTSFLRNVLLIKNMKWDRNRNFFKNSLLYFYKFCLLPITRHKTIVMINKKISKFKSETMTRYVGQLSIKAYGMKKAIFESSWFEKSTFCKFEDYCFMVPLMSDTILKAVYSDYMQLPPIEKRITHHDFYAYDLLNKKDVK